MRVTTMTYRHELHGWAKFWARIRRKPWAWNYICDVVFDPQGRNSGDGTVAFDFRPVGPMRREVAS